jgi:hypothetical protein
MFINALVIYLVNENGVSTLDRKHDNGDDLAVNVVFWDCEKR